MKAFLSGLFVGVAGLALWGAAQAAPVPVDMIIHGGQVLTVDKAFSIRKAVAVKEGKIVAVGGEDLLRRYQAPTVIDLKGRTLMPGFMDTHVHIEGESVRTIDPSKARSIADIQAMLRAKAKALGPGVWINGRGWDEAQLAEKRNLTRYDLDAAAPDNPVVLTRAGSHSSVGNSMALKLAGIDRTTPDPPRGVIERGADGEPNGIIRERSDLYYHLEPPESAEELRDSQTAKIRDLLRLGITSFISAGDSLDDEPADAGGTGKPASGMTWKRLQAIYQAHGTELPRVAAMITYPGGARLKAFPHHTGYGDERIRIGAIGESGVDGGFTGPTAWTLQDYKGQPGFHGRPQQTQEQFDEMLDTAASLGWQMGVHSIGDAAIVFATDGYDRALKKYPGKDRRWFLAHLTMTPPEATYETLARDHIIAEAQPNFLYSLEGRYNETLEGFRLEHINPVGTPLRHGIFVAFGSDRLPIDPRMGLYAAITRKGPSGRAYAFKDEAVSRAEAIRLYTAAGPYLTWEETIKGSLEPGKLADMIVLPADPLTMPEQDILTMPVDLTIVGGRVVYDRAATRSE